MTRRSLLHALALCAGLGAGAAATTPTADLPEHQAVALPVEDITLDGDLSDWPAGMPSLPIRNHFAVYGATDIEEVDLGHSPDLSPSMMVGYDAAAQLLYVAVQVRDDELRNPSSGEASDTDACEIYVSGLSGDGAGNAPVKYVMVPGRHSYSGYAGNPAVAGGTIGDTDTRGAWKRRGDVTTYEWRVQVFDRFPGRPAQLEAGEMIGFDAVVVDADSRGNTAWVPWGPAVGSKDLGNDRIGRLVLGEAARVAQAESTAQIAETVARTMAAAQAGVVAAAEARVAQPSRATWELVPRLQRPLPLPPPDRSVERKIVNFVGSCAAILMIGFAAYLIRRGGKGRADGDTVAAMSERMASIESRLTDTQDVMIALSEKLDRIDGRASREDDGSSQT